MKTNPLKSTAILFFILAFIGTSCSDDGTSQIKTVEETGISETSEITCPKCGHTEVEKLPTVECLIAYDCNECGETMQPEGDDCCVFCTHGTHKCPSIQKD